MKKDFVFILVEPLYPGNVGSAARVINNFGFENLRIVGTIPKKEENFVAVHSENIMQSIGLFPTLADALNDTDNAIMFTRRKGKKKATDFYSNETKDFINKLPRGKTALVFGRETYGLTDAEADLCPIRCFIPTDEAFPSLNLAQAVAIIAYELHLGLQKYQPKTILADKVKITELCNSIIVNLEMIGYFQSGDKNKAKKILLNTLLKGYTNEESISFLNRMFDRIRVLFSKESG